MQEELVDSPHATTLRATVVLEEFCRELAATVLVQSNALLTA